MGKVEEKAMRRRMLRLQIHLWKEEEKEEGGGQEEGVAWLRESMALSQCSAM